MEHSQQTKNLPIGVFDSGVGGLTVLHALQKLLPQENFIYLGDTARLPYGTKGDTTIARYTTQVAEHLFDMGIKLLVIACNTASTYGFPLLKISHPHFPIVDVIQPGAEKAVELTKTGHILILATEATVRGKSYHSAIQQLNPSTQVSAKACGLFVALVEEGFSSGFVPEEVARFYLKPYLTEPQFSLIDSIVLACTHFPLLRDTIAKIIPDHVHIIDSAVTTAVAVKNELLKQNLINENVLQGQTSFIVTDAPERFCRVAERILGQKVSEYNVELVDLK